VVAFLGAARAFALRFFIALVASFLVLNAALYAADRVAATKIDEATRLDFRQGSLHDNGKADDPGQPANFLIVGSDTRGFVHSAIDVSHYGSASGDPGARSDTLMIAHIDPNAKQAIIVSFPRDLRVMLPGGCHQKINAAYNQDFRCNSHSSYGGPQQIVDTLKSNFNISINHYVEVNFPGFRQMVDVLGSVPIYFPARARDLKSGLSVNGGCQNLTGIMALNYVRSRYFQYYDYATGGWVDDPQSDLSRIRRQQYFIRTLMQTAVDKGARDPITAFDFAGKMAHSLAIDKNFSLSDLKRLIKTFRLTDPGSVQMLTVPTEAGPDGDLVLAPNADSVLATLRSFAPAPTTTTTTMPAIDPADVKIEVRNASGVTKPAPNGATGDWVSNRASQLLRQYGYSVAVGASAPLSDHTIVEFTSASAPKAYALLSHMAHPPKLVQVTKLNGGADLLFLVGKPGSGLIDPSAPATTTTTTTPTTSSTTGSTAPTTTTTVPLPNPGVPPAGTPASSVKSQWIGCR
jgi:LCP family protein required for cell wall assembly